MVRAKITTSPFPDLDPERAEDLFKIWEYQPNLHLASTMQQYAGYDEGAGAQDGLRPPFLIGGRRWWAALGRLSSAMALGLAVAVELMFVMRDASADVSSLSANTGSTSDAAADAADSNQTSQASEDSSSDASEDTGSDYLGDADYLYYDEADGKYYEDDGSGKAVRRLGRLLVRQIANAASETTKQQKKNSTSSLDASSAGNSSSSSGTANAAGSGNSTAVCQWVTDTDVQNSGGGVPLAVSFHLLTAGILIIAVLAEVHIFRRQLHASAMLNVGVVQLWVGLGILSRSFDLFGELAGYALMLAGFGNLVFGTMARFEVGGPGAALFATAKAPSPEQYAEQQALLIAASGAASGQQREAAAGGQAVKGDPAAPTPYLDEKEAMKEVLKLAEAAKTQTASVTAQGQAPAAAVPTAMGAYGLGGNGLLTPGLTPGGAQHPQFVLPNPTDNSGYDAGMPLLNQLAVTNPMLQRQVLQALSTPGGVAYANGGVPSLLDNGTTAAVPPPHLMGPYAGVMPQMTAAASSSEAGSSRSGSSHRHHRRKFKHSGRS